jgi:flagellin
MSLINSVNTNMGAMIALESLNKTNSALAAAQKQVSTGYRLADATDDGAAYAVAQSVRSTVGALTTANQQLGSVQGLLSTTQSGLNKISDTMASMRDVLIEYKNSGDSNYLDQYKTDLANVKAFIQDAAYSGKTLIGDMTGSSGTKGSFNVVRNEFGATYTIASQGMSAMFTSIAGLSSGNTTNIAAALTSTGMFLKQQAAVTKSLNTVGASVNYVNNQISYNNDKIDALNSGLGSLVDADLAKESAQIQSLQIRQQLGTQALSMANQAPQTLLSLFK